MDCVCDGSDDKGVDGIYVDEIVGRVDVLQAKLFRGGNKTLGDTALKEFVGTLAQFRDPQFIRNMTMATRNTELAAILRDKQVADKVEKGYGVRGIFATNATRNADASSYLATQADIVVYDDPQLQAEYIHLETTGPISGPVTFDISATRHIEYNTSEARTVIAPIAASELVAMDGIQNQDLFAWNVRQSLGRTNVNKDIEGSIQDRNEHQHFLLYHNGLTILCKSLDIQGDKITIDGYSVVNGCQSLTTLFNNHGEITDDLMILTRIIRVLPDSPLASKITRYTNNQNGIKARDLQSTSAIQTRLQAEISQRYPDVAYIIKRGEATTRPVTIDNELAARILLACDNREPWSCHQTYKLFDELHAAVFGRPEVTADRIIAWHIVYETIANKLPRSKHAPFASYSLTKFLLLYLVRQALEADATGKAFISDPKDFVRDNTSRQVLADAIGTVVQDLLVDVDGELGYRETSGASFDYKRELKSPNAVRQLERDVLAMYRKTVDRKRVPSFTEAWQQGLLTPK